ncbi:cyclin-dependent protein kinase inhibitor [Auriscalpium vulgare]|uniref:Cyclin-dependent protein kinase inhibitor n=1 Tax=Auriscalpium vulgare TaxID=40419 RepID=A0ACB8RT93_9AGAM|nr:cyclin-dependent protein kinase inhibitor [Auriscalpium vulgare]
MEFFNDIGGDPLKPSLFELVAQEQLRDLLQPALKYVLSVFAQRYPRYLLRVVNRHEEFYAAIMLFVERHYLRTHNASFAENFYGLKRRRKPFFETERARASVGGISPEDKLRSREILRSLLTLVGIPYLRAKAQDYFEELGGGIDHDILDTESGSHVRDTHTEASHATTSETMERLTRPQTFRARLKEFYRQTYPWLNMTFEVWLLAYNVAYLFDKSPFHRPWLSWVGVDVRRLGIDDFRLAASNDRQKGVDVLHESLLRRLLRGGPRLLLESFRILLPTAIFFIKFLEWWYSPSSPARALSTSPLGPAIPPPRMLPPHPKGIAVDGKMYGYCPLCQTPITNATALPSGYVFCYRCAYEQVEKHGKCPVTLLPTRVWQLRKVLVQVSGHEGALPRTRTLGLATQSPSPQFGKQLQAEIIPGWSDYYLDYKFLKKIVSSLAAKRPASEAAALALGIRPGHILHQSTVNESLGADASSLDANEPPLVTSSSQDDDRGPDFQAHKAAFFFKLERELEKVNAFQINSFYLRKEAELKLRLETLLSKRRAAALRVLPNGIDDTTQNYVEWKAVEEGFHLLERDLAKLQINGTGFRKILKKWDKRSKSTTKELYLARQVDVQPVFNRQLISELSDTVTACLIDITDVSVGLALEGDAVSELIINRQMTVEGNTQIGLFRDLESNLRKAVASQDEASIRSLVTYSDTLGQQHWGRGNITRILWKAVIDAPQPLADLILATSGYFDFQFVDDINGRTCLHEASIAGELRLVDLCLLNGVDPHTVDVYGRSAFHYAAMNGHVDICRRLLERNVSPYVRDMENYSPLVYATLRGSLDCVRVLLVDGGVPAEPSSPDGDLNALSLASLAGHLDVALLLLEHGARSLPNNNGEYPIHFAARQGHANICRLLVQHDGWDLPDKYNEWSPLFHAARYGHDASVRVLLAAGARTDIVDELGNNALHYAAWYGHQNCVSILSEASYRTFKDEGVRSPSDKSTGSSALRAMESDIDLIPSLSLPPPMMPHRVYGHNYLVKQCLVQVTIGDTGAKHNFPSTETQTGVRLHPRFTTSPSTDNSMLSSPLLKLVMTSSPAATSAPHTVSLPIGDEVHVLTFQTAFVDQLSLEFSLYPNFGTKTIGRAVAVPSLLRKAEFEEMFTLPILDHRLHPIGEVSFEINVITPFEGVTLQIGGAVETYWKSLSVGALPTRRIANPRFPRSRPIASASPSPAGSMITTSATQAITVSSITGSYLYLVVQVTRDLHPVVFADWKLPEEHFDLNVVDVTLDQFVSLTSRLGRSLPDVNNLPSTVSEWHKLACNSMASLESFMKVVPSYMGLCLELAYPSRKRFDPFRRLLPLNDFVDSILRSIYQTSVSPDGAIGRRKIIFTSFSPDTCAAVNWKQPNYPVFFASLCGRVSLKPPSVIARGAEEAYDERLSSLGSAVEFSKNNNLLGVFVDNGLLVEVPSLVRAVRDAGLLIATYGPTHNIPSLLSARDFEGVAVDAFFQDGVLAFQDNFSRAWM